MKTSFWAAVVGVSALGTLAGCASQSSPSTTASTAEPTKHTVTQQDLSRSTRTQPAEQLQAADPAITTSSGR